MAGKLIVFEGTDGSGKSTQFQKLCQRVTQTGREFQKLVFPQYSEPSSALIRMYLNGEFGPRPEDVNPYAASAFYAVDRYASYKKVWGTYYERGGLILTDRYTTSNAVHQTVKCPPQERGEFLRWLDDFEHTKLGCPGPIWSSIWTCPPTRRWPSCAGGRRTPIPMRIFTSWIPPIWLPAGKAPSRRPSCWGGR